MDAFAAAALPGAALSRVLPTERPSRRPGRHELDRALADLRRAPLGTDRGHLGVRTLQIGPNPLRVLVVGGGLAVGYGVHDRRDAVDGPLARALAAATGRGIVLDNRAGPEWGIDRVRRELGASGSLTFQLVIAFLPFVELTTVPGVRASRRPLRDLVEHLLADSSPPILVPSLPPAGDGALQRPMRRRFAQGNAVLDDVAGALPDVEVVPLDEPFSLDGLRSADSGAQYYDRIAAALLPASLRALRLTASGRSGPTDRPDGAGARA